MVLEFVKFKGVEVKFHGRGKNEASHYCGQCEVGVLQTVQNTPVPRLPANGY